MHSLNCNKSTDEEEEEEEEQFFLVLHTFSFLDQNILLLAKNFLNPKNILSKRSFEEASSGWLSSFDLPHGRAATTATTSLGGQPPPPPPPPIKAREAQYMKSAKDFISNFYNSKQPDLKK